MCTWQLSELDSRAHVHSVTHGQIETAEWFMGAGQLMDGGLETQLRGAVPRNSAGQTSPKKNTKSWPPVRVAEHRHSSAFLHSISGTANISPGNCEHPFSKADPFQASPWPADSYARASYAGGPRRTSPNRDRQVLPPSLLSLAFREPVPRTCATSGCCTGEPCCCWARDRAPSEWAQSRWAHRAQCEPQKGSWPPSLIPSLLQCTAFHGCGRWNRVRKLAILVYFGAA